MSLLHLPIKPLTRICEYLRDEDDIRRLAHVCSSLRMFANDIAQRRCWHYFRQPCSPLLGSWIITYVHEQRLMRYVAFIPAYSEIPLRVTLKAQTLMSRAPEGCRKGDYICESRIEWHLDREFWLELKEVHCLAKKIQTTLCRFLLF